MPTNDFKFFKPGEVRVRIAPSPTGFLHIGSARTALFNFLFAQSHQGSFILRIEDTDAERSDPRFEKDIIENLKWLGIEWNEGPYRQSQRLNIYAKYLEKLIQENQAYYCFCSEKDLEAQRQYQLSIGEAPHYNGKCAQLSPEEVKKGLTEGKPTVIRFRMPPKKVDFEDLIRGKVEFDASLMGDLVIAKNLSNPLYNFAVVVDDFEMKISHVIRGEEHLSNTPKQILLQEALGFPRPLYAHLPLILGQDRTKLSKRHGSVSVSQYKKEGYLAEALINFMAFLGWNPGGEREIYSLPSLIKEFSLERVQKAGAVLNIKRLDYLNGFYIRQRSIEKITELCIPYLIEAGLIGKVEGKDLKLFGDDSGFLASQYIIRETGEEISFDTLKKIFALYQERLKKLSEISELTDFFFRDSLKYSKDLLKWEKMSDEEVKESLEKSEKTLSDVVVENWTRENLEKILLLRAEEAGLPAQAGDRGRLLWPLRVALTGKEASAGPFEIAAILGKEKTLKRISDAKFLISNS